MIEFIVGVVLGAVIVYFIGRNEKVQEKLGITGMGSQETKEDKNIQVK